MRSLVLFGVLLVSGCSKPPSPTPLDALVQALTSKTPGKDEILAEYLAKQGKDTEPYLGFPGYSGGYAMSVRDCLRLKIEGRPYVVVELGLKGIDIPGEVAERLVLINEFGTVVDVATAVWPSRLMKRIRAEVLDPPGLDNAVLRVTDEDAKTNWGNFEALYFVVEGKKQTRTPLPWTGDRCLGELSVEKERFVVLPRKK